MYKHTEGPWVVCIEDGDNKAFTVFSECQLDENNRISADDFSHMCICTAGLNHENFEANARLIAAAPELLESLQELVQILEKMLMIQGEPKPGSIGHKARAAIAKAKSGDIDD